MKLLSSFVVVLLCLFARLAIAQSTADAFIFPVKSDAVTYVQENTVNPLASGGGWYVNNDFGTNWNTTFGCCSPGGQDYPYHPGMDYNRNDGEENEGNDVPVYSISDGTVIRVVDLGSLGWAILIRYDLSSSHDLNDYVISGTTPTSTIPNASSIVAMYLHLSGNAFGLSSGDHRPPSPTITVTKGQLLGHISSDLDHLHFEIRAGTSDQTAAVNSHQEGGYYDSQQAITDFNNIDPNGFLEDHVTPSFVGYYSDGWHDASQEHDPSQPILDAYIEYGGSSLFGSPWDNGSTPFVHTWPTGGDPSSQDVVVLQDFSNNGVHRAIALSPGRSKGYYVASPISGFWFANTGYMNYGSPITNAESGKYAGGVLGVRGTQVTFQKFGKINLQTGGTLKTIGYRNNAPNSVGHHPAGKLTLSGSPGDIWWIDDDESGTVSSGDRELFTIGSTGSDWVWIDAGNYIVLRVAPNGSIVSSVAHTVWEGNNQNISPDNPTGTQAPTITSITVNSMGFVDLVWTNVNAKPYAIYRDGVAVGQTIATSFSDQSVQVGRVYTYSVSGNGTPQSNQITIATPDDYSGGGGANTGPIVVTSPPGGIRYDLGSTMLISWSGEENVQIEVSRDNGQTWSVLVVAIGMTSYYWQDIPGPESAQCRIRVSENGNPSRSALSPGTFIIGNPPQPPEWPKTVEAENMQGGVLVSEGRQLTTQDWYLFTGMNFQFPNAGLLEIEVVAKAGGQINDGWPQLFVKVGSQSSAAQTVNLTSYQTYLFKNFSLSQGGGQSVELNLSETTRSVPGHSVTVDKVIIRYVFSGIPARLNMTCNTIGSTVELYNVESGYFTQTLLPCSNFPVQGGEYNLRIQKNGYFVWNSTYRFTPDVTSTIHADLEQVPIELVLSSVTLNSGFESGLANWSATEANGNTVAASSDAFSGSTSANMSVPQAGEAWQAGLYQAVSVTNQQLYMVRFKAKASVSRSIIATLSSDAPSWTTYNFWEQIPITMQWQEYSRSFSAQHVINGTDPAALLLFQAGHESGDIYIDEVEFGLAPLSDRTTEQLLVVEDFEHGSLGSWMVYNSSGNNAGGSNTGHYSGEYAARFDVTNPGTDGDLSMRHLVESDPNSQYRVSFWAISTTGSRPITVSFGEEGGSWAIYGLYETPVVTAQWQSFEYAFTPTTSDPDAIILFKVGQSAGTLFIDDIVVRKVDPANSLSNNSFENGTLGGWNVAAASGNTIIADPHAGNDGIFSARFDIAQNGSFFDLSIRQGVSVLASHAYTFSFWAKNVQNRTIEIVCSQEGGSWTTNGLYANTPLEVSGWAYYTYEFTPDFDDANGTIIIKGGQTQGSFWIDGLRFEDSGLSKQAIPESAHTAAIPAAYALYQCYPNPFNPETTIRYALKEPTFVRLTVYTMLGQLVRVLIDVPQETAGMKEVIWDGRNSKGEFVASGTYFYRLEVNGFTDVKKMAVVK